MVVWDLEADHTFWMENLPLQSNLLSYKCGGVKGIILLLWDVVEQSTIK